MAEKDVVEELLSIHNNAINRMQTFSKYSMDAQQQADLEYKITQASAQMKEQHFEEIVQASLEKSQTASKKRINAIFKDFDNNAQEGYEVENVEDLENDFNQLFQMVKSKFSERKVGSERSMNFVEALKDRLPQVYSEMMTAYQKNQIKAVKAKKKDEAKQLNKLDDEIEKLQEELEKLENGTYVDQSDDEEDSDDDYDS